MYLLDNQKKTSEIELFWVHAGIKRAAFFHFMLI